MTVGAGPQEFMHTITGGQPTSPPMVLVPGYGARLIRLPQTPGAVLSACYVLIWCLVHVRGLFAEAQPFLLPAVASRHGCSYWARYGAGAGFYFRNIDGLARHFRVHAVDLLGTGMSGKARAAGCASSLFRLTVPAKGCRCALQHHAIGIPGMMCILA